MFKSAGLPLDPRGPAKGTISVGCKRFIYKYIWNNVFTFNSVLFKLQVSDGRIVHEVSLLHSGCNRLHSAETTKPGEAQSCCSHRRETCWCFNSSTVYEESLLCTSLLSTLKSTYISHHIFTVHEKRSRCYISCYNMRGDSTEDRRHQNTWNIFIHLHWNNVVSP